MQKYYPEPNTARSAFLTSEQLSSLQASYPAAAGSHRVQDRPHFNDRQRMFGRYTFMDSVYSKPNYWGNIADPGCCDPMNQRLQNGALDYLNTLNNTTVLNIRYGFGRVSGNRYPWSKGFQVSTLGLPSFIDQISNQPVFPTVTIQDYTQLGPNGGDVYLMGDCHAQPSGESFQSSGRHSLRFGVDVRFNLVNYGQLGTPSGTFNFERCDDARSRPARIHRHGRHGYASFLLGSRQQRRTTAGGGSITHQIRPANANKYYAAYIQDDFKLSRSLTINAGSDGTSKAESQSGTTTWPQSIPTSKNPVSSISGSAGVRAVICSRAVFLGRRAIRDTSPRQINPRIGLGL